MANFPTPSTSPAAPHPSYGEQKRSAPNVRQVIFGDGYSQRLQFGLNQDLKSYTFRWRNISKVQATVIEDFLEARGGTESFDYTPPAESSARKFLCTSWTKSIPYVNRATINAVFREVAEP